MKKAKGQKIVIIGCGNLAWHLTKHFSEQKKFELFVYNHQPNKALSVFKNQFGCATGNNLSGIIDDASFYFICVSDKFIAPTSQKIKTTDPSSLVIHTSGSTSIKEIKKENSAVFYPLQTFSKQDSVKWMEIPILIEANKKKDLEKLKTLAFLFSKKVVPASSTERSKIHLAAVLVNNFTNALYTAADDLMREQIKNTDLGFDLLLPLIEQTASKVKRISPLKAQTGPARRNDKDIMKTHLRFLKHDKTLKKIYKQLSSLIAGQQKNAHA